MVGHAVHFPTFHRHSFGDDRLRRKGFRALQRDDRFAIDNGIDRKHILRINVLYGLRHDFGLRRFRGGRLLLAGNKAGLLRFVKLLLHQLHLHLHRFKIRVAAALTCRQAEQHQRCEQHRQKFFHVSVPPLRPFRPALSVCQISGPHTVLQPGLWNEPPFTF